MRGRLTVDAHPLRREQGPPGRDHGLGLAGLGGGLQARRDLLAAGFELEQGLANLGPSGGSPQGLGIELDQPCGRDVQVASRLGQLLLRRVE